MVEARDFFEVSIERRKGIDCSFMLQREQERVVRVEHTVAIGQDVQDVARQALPFVSKEAHLSVVDQLRIKPRPAFSPNDPAALVGADD